MEMARAKLARKGCDLLVVNDVSGGRVFGSPDNEAVVLDAAGEADRGAARLEVGAGARGLGPGRRPAAPRHAEHLAQPADPLAQALS